MKVEDLSSINYLLGFADATEYKHAKHGEDYYLVLTEIMEYLREKRKYSEIKPESWAQIEEYAHEVLAEYGVLLW